PAAIYLHTTTAFVLAMNKSRELWHTAVMVPIFLTSATASGIALLIIFAYILQATGRMKFKPSMFRSLSTLLATVMIIDLFLLCVEILMVFWPTSAMPGHTTRLIEFLTGRLAFSLLPVLILGFTAFGLLARRKTRHLPQVQLTAAVLYVVAVFFKRYALMAMGFSFTTLGQEAPVYFPSMVETFLALGILAFGLLFVTVAVKVLPIEVPEEEHSHAEVTAVASEPAVSRTPALEPAAEPVMEQALEPGVSS
ncbi:MAG: polysulfide reductase NrfD, partial [Coriobacteriales bacterium]|nr:polysulfide reductase NrfD [Coriobacteriales bacterium]